MLIWLERLQFRGHRPSRSYGSVEEHDVPAWPALSSDKAEYSIPTLANECQIGTIAAATCALGRIHRTHV